MPVFDLNRLRAERLSTVQQLHAINGEPSELIRNKHTDRLTPLLQAFIEGSPMCFMATADADGGCDVSPRGDTGGCARVLDARTLVVADRLGNRRVDSHRNLLQNPQLGLIFVVPGVDEAVRVNGHAFLSTDAELLATLAVQGRVPKIATVVEIDEVFVHCARAMLRAGLWQPSSWADPDGVPTLQAMLAEQKQLPPPDETQGKRNEAYRRELY